MSRRPLSPAAQRVGSRFVFVLALIIGGMLAFDGLRGLLTGEFVGTTRRGGTFVATGATARLMGASSLALAVGIVAVPRLLQGRNAGVFFGAMGASVLLRLATLFL